MPEGVLGVSLRDISGLVHDLFEKLGGEDGPTWLEAFKRFLRKENPWPSLLEFMTTVNLPAIAAFSAKDHFKVGEVEGVKIGFLGKIFKQEFLAAAGKMEPALSEPTILRIHRLLKGSLDAPIIAELGGEEKAETTLAQMWEMMKKQGRGQEGNLLTNSYANIFYIRDANGVLWAAHCSWFSDFADWGVEANPVTAPNGWDAGHQVVSR